MEQKEEGIAASKLADEKYCVLLNGLAFLI